MTNEELHLKQRAKRRLIGAVTLVTGLVVFLPMVLDNEPKPVAEDIAINIPSQDGNAAKGAAVLPQKIGVPEITAPEIVTPKSAVAIPEHPVPPLKSAPPIQPLTVLPGGQAPKPAQAHPPEPPKPEKAAVASDEIVKEAAKPASAAPPQHQPEQAASAPEKPAEPARPAAPKETKPAKPPAKPAEAVAPAQGGFVVRLGAFAKPENAKQLKAKVAAMGIRNYSGILKTASGDKTLVRAGPYATRKEAEAVRDRLKAADVAGDVVPR